MKSIHNPKSIRLIFDSLISSDYGNTHSELLECVYEAMLTLCDIEFSELYILGDMHFEWQKLASEHDLNYLTAPSKWEFCTQFYCAYYGIAHELKDEEDAA